MPATVSTGGPDLGGALGMGIGQGLQESLSNFMKERRAATLQAKQSKQLEDFLKSKEGSVFNPQQQQILKLGLKFPQLQGMGKELLEQSKPPAAVSEYQKMLTENREKEQKRKGHTQIGAFLQNQFTNTPGMMQHSDKLFDIYSDAISNYEGGMDIAKSIKAAMSKYIPAKEEKGKKGKSQTPQQETPESLAPMTKELWEETVNKMPGSDRAQKVKNATKHLESKGYKIER